MKESNIVYIPEYERYKKFLALCKLKEYPINIKKHKHHIIPKFMGGGNGRENIVLLSEEDHIKAHLLFSECFEVDSKEYIGNLRSSRLLSKNNSIDEENSKKIKKTFIGENNPFYGKKHRPEVIEKLKQNTFENRTNISYDEFYGADANNQKEIRSAGVKKYWDSMPEEQRKKRIKTMQDTIKNLPPRLPHNAIEITINGITYNSIKQATMELNISLYKFKKIYGDLICQK